ncbi:MAG TPA: serine/threonine-protein kinase, partial [Gemmatimonadota bacterium]|nr:serine/threonine-protein kinase [Gemmatimonadota bacterium]
DPEKTPPEPGKGGGDELEELLRKELAPDLQLVRRLGRGSMGNVYLAREEALKRLVAVKVLSPRLARDKQARARFEREAQSVAALSHPNIVAVYRVGRLSNDLPYMVMQYVKGTTMSSRLQAQGPLSVSEARRVMGEVASAMAAAHKQGIVHRDVRPDNVLYEEDSGRSLLSDFGIAAILARGDSGAPTRITKTGELVGDPSYMSPEQLVGGEITERSDVYALGLLGFELLTGRGPYEASSKREMFTAHVHQQPRKLSDLRDGVDPELERVLEACLNKEPEHRPSAADVQRRLAIAASGGLTPGSGLASHPSLQGQATSGLFGKVKERYLPQIMLVYGAIAWGALQVAWQLVESHVLPDVIYRLTLVAVVTGLPAVFIGAWFHGKKGRQEFRPIEYWLFGGLFIIWLVVSALILISWISR